MQHAPGAFPEDLGPFLDAPPCLPHAPPVSAPGLPAADWQMDIEALCEAMPFMVGCTLAEQCMVGGAGQPPPAGSAPFCSWICVFAVRAINRSEEAFSSEQMYDGAATVSTQPLLSPPPCCARFAPI